MFFKQLAPEEEKQFRQYARENDPPDLDDWELYHPVCREEWIARGIRPKNECEECGHKITLHGKDGCEVELGDKLVGGHNKYGEEIDAIPMAQGPCGCKAHIDGGKNE
jgi:hypothetical protein